MTHPDASPEEMAEKYDKGFCNGETDGVGNTGPYGRSWLAGYRAGSASRKKCEHCDEEGDDDGKTG
jgi:hypothetical protein